MNYSSLDPNKPQREAIAPPLVAPGGYRCTPAETMTPEQLAVRLHAMERIWDKSAFRRRARMLQSLWREQHGLPIGEHEGRKLGSRLAMPDAKSHFWNFISDNIKAAVSEEVLNPAKSRGKLYRKPWIFNDLLSSQALCFNLFAELQGDLTLAARVLPAVTDGRIHSVASIQFEYSPGRGDARYLNDRSAFDVFVTFNTPAGGRGFVGIEVKYHENLKDESAAHRDRYNEVARSMNCFKADAWPRLCATPLQQIWRDHMLGGILRLVDIYDDGFFLFLYPEGNLHCQKAVEAYRSCLTSDASFVSLTLEALVCEVRRQTGEGWVEGFYDRYLDFGKIDRLLGRELA